MSDAIKCDGCGKVVERETLYFDIETVNRFVGGDFVDYEGTNHEWDHEETHGDLCGECASPVVELLNETLKHD